MARSTGTNGVLSRGARVCIVGREAGKLGLSRDTSGSGIGVVRLE
jgi:hypothetical protein